MNICPNCGAQINRSDSFCESCGSQIKKKSTLNLGVIIAALAIVVLGGLILLCFINRWGPFAPNSQNSISNTNIPSQTSSPTTNPSIAPTIVGAPEDAIKDYYDNLIKIKYSNSYNSLSKANRDSTSQKDYLKWKYLKKVYSVDKSYGFVKVSEKTDSKLEGKVYEKVVTFKITKNIVDSSYKNPKQSLKYDDYVVLENGEWKLHILEMNIKSFIAYAYSDIAYKYEQGRGYSRNYAKAVQNYKYALKYLYRDGFTHHGLAYCYKALKNYKASIPYIKNAVLFYKTKKLKAEACVTAGNIYYALHNTSKARAYYNTALKLDPKNADAKYNLKNM